VILKIKENKGLDNNSFGLPAGFPTFVPCRGLSNGHLQTIAGNFYPRQAFRLAAVSETVEVDPADGSRVL